MHTLLSQSSTIHICLFPTKQTGGRGSLGDLVGVLNWRTDSFVSGCISVNVCVGVCIHTRQQNIMVNINLLAALL